MPAPREHFLSLAYHALYHKGAASGIPIDSERQKRRKRPRITTMWKYSAGLPTAWACRCRDYAGRSRRLPRCARLAAAARYVDSAFATQSLGAVTVAANRIITATADDRLAVFLVREEALRRGGVERAVQLIEKFGFQTFTTRTFDERRVATLARSLRGGNWGRGPWPISGGPPVAAIVAYDPAPITPTRRQKKRFPFIANARLLCKEQLRDAFNEGFSKDQHCNVIHSSDNGREAMDYLRIIMPDEVEDLLAGISSPPVARAA